MIDINETTDKEYIYLSFPKNYYNIINKVIYATADIGKEILNDCNIVCSNKGLIIMKLWNDLQIISYAEEYNKLDEINKLISYIARFVINNDDILTLENEIFIFIPERYVCTYHKLLNLVATNKDNFKNNVCDNKFVIKCLLTFNSAIANYHLKNYKLANLLINYLETELKDTRFTKDLNEVFINESKVENNNFVSIVGCIDIKFDMDFSTGRLSWSGNKELVDSFNIDNGHLKVTYGSDK